MGSEHENQLRLVNNKSVLTSNICFVNSSIQLLKNTGFVKFILSIRSSLNRDMDVCGALADLLGEQTSHEKSSRMIRKLVAEKTKMFY